MADAPTNSPAVETPGGPNGRSPSAAKKRIGRPPGSPKVPGSGRKKRALAPRTPPSRIGKSARIELAEKSNYLDFICKVAQGKPIRMRGPTGKQGQFYHPSFADRKWAVELVVNKLVPTVTATELSGADGSPIQIEAGRIDNFDIARRLLYGAGSLGVGEAPPPMIDAPEPEPDPALVAPDEDELPDELPDMLQAGEQVVTGDWLIRARNGTFSGVAVIPEIYTTSGSLIRTVPSLTAGLQVARDKDPHFDSGQLLEISLVPEPPEPGPQPYDSAAYVRPAVIR